MKIQNLGLNYPVEKVPDDSCRHFGVCGGCSRQHLSYEDQLKAKASRFEMLAQSLGFEGPVLMEAAPNPWFYRNKIELSFARATGDPLPAGQTSPEALRRGAVQGEGATLGFKEKGKWYRSFDLEECRIFDPEIGSLVERVRAWANRHHLAPYDSRRHTGFLRYLVIRKGLIPREYSPNPQILDFIPNTAVSSSSSQKRGSKVPDETRGSGLKDLDSLWSLRSSKAKGGNDGAEKPAPPDGTGASTAEFGRMHHWLLVLVTARGQVMPAKDLMADLDRLGFSYSLFWGLQERFGDTAEMQSAASLKGEPFLWQPILGRPFRYGISSFFQTNPAVFEKLLLDLFSKLNKREWPVIFDLYCGVGSIALTIAGSTHAPILGVEFSAASISDAWFNADALCCSSVSFLEAKIESAVKQLCLRPDWKEGAVILDPPRSGLHPKVLEAIVNHPPRLVAYVSCNPALACRQDLPRLSENYKITFIKAYDFFPQTEHYEAFFVMERK
ncbi:MAG: class I SAM-dependent RNA methyltransferase [Elusimicrobia bacterium]|nr:class I SAM-dependent RNA methyltransferase [Elusimicrobiota bacterium]